MQPLLMIEGLRIFLHFFSLKKIIIHLFNYNTSNRVESKTEDTGKTYQNIIN